MYEEHQSLALVDPTLEEFNEEEAIRMIGVALLCTQGSPLMRPSMSRAVAMLTGDIAVSAAKSKPSYMTDWNFKDITEDMETSPSPVSQAILSGESDIIREGR